MTSFLADTVYQRLCDHRAIAANPEWLRLAYVAGDALSELYQAIGTAHLSQP